MRRAGARINVLQTPLYWSLLGPRRVLSAKAAKSTRSMPRRKASSTPSAAIVEVPANGERVDDPAAPLEPVKVNNSNLQELKIACDDAVRRVRGARRWYIRVD